MSFSENDLRAAQLKRLEEIRDECENQRGQLVPLKDIAVVVKSTVDFLAKLCRANSIMVTAYNWPEHGNRRVLCVSEQDAEKVVRLVYK